MNSNDCREPKLEVLICTMGTQGIQRVATMTLPRVDGVIYTVSWQKPSGPIPPGLSRDDIKVMESHTVGLSNNRNDAFGFARAPLLLIADDDLHYTPSGLNAVIGLMETNHSLDFATFMHRGGDNKSFPSHEFDMARPAKGYYVTSFEIAVRRHVVKGADRVAFDPRFGLGVERFGAGEEQLFINDMLRKGMQGRFFPVIIATHPGLTTSHRQLTPSLLRAQGAVQRDTLPGYRALARLINDARRYAAHHRYPFFKSLKWLIDGWRFKR